MSEADAVARTGDRGPATVGSLQRDLRSLGLAPGQTLIAHTSLSRLGWVAGGPQAVVDALLGLLGPGGTLVMPTHTAGLTDPRGWSNPAVPREWWETIREAMPAFDPRRTPSTHMGATAEAFRTRPGVVRSNHPVGSFAAHGRLAEEITGSHPLEDIFGDSSPLGRLYDSGASVLLLGVGHDNNTSLHLAESRVRDEWRPQGSPVIRDGKRVWVTYRERQHDSNAFPKIAEDYAAAGGEISRGGVGAGEGQLVAMRGLVDFAAGWLRRHPPDGL